jgi:hypothetical protein
MIFLRTIIIAQLILNALFYDHFIVVCMVVCVKKIITINTQLSLIYTIHSSPLHTHYDSQSSLVVPWQRILTQTLTFQLTMKSSCYFVFSHSGISELKDHLDSLLQLTADS